MSSCTTTADCAGVTDGCCATWEIVSVGENNVFGSFNAIWGGNDSDVVVGNSFNSCAVQGYMEDHWADNPDGTTPNYTDLALWLSYNGEYREDLGLGPDDDVDDWIAAWGSNQETQENLILAVGCVDASENPTQDEEESPEESGAAALMASSLAALVAAISLF